MKKLIFLLIAFGMAATSVRAQTRFLSKGKIEYERKIDVKRQYDPADMDNFMKDMIARMPTFHSSYFDLYFSGNETWYTPVPDDTHTNSMVAWTIGPAKDNIILTDLNRKTIQSRKDIFDETFALQDSLRHIDWRITPERRTIAGFECRKAVGIICDSVYVVAFYTDEILVSGGPESFNGLPGMILGLAIPRLYTTWFATKVELVSPDEKDFKVPSRGKKVTRRTLMSTLGESLKNWGKNGQRYIWWALL